MNINIFNDFYRKIFRIGTGSPISFFYWECSTLKVEFLILQRKLNFAFHLANLPIGSLGRDFFDVQEREKMPSTLLAELQEHLVKIDFGTTRNLSKARFKKKIRKYITELNRATLLEEIKQYKKIDYETCLLEENKRKTYFFENSLDQVRDIYRVKCKMVESIRGNFPQKYRKDSLTCQSCKHLYPSNPSPDTIRDSQSHLLESCAAFTQTRSFFNLDTDIGIVNFLKEVIRHRIENNQV